jgi:glycosyltransferase involved in cell wall biosynthesis
MSEFMAVGKPVVLGVEGDARSIVTEAGAGIFYTPEDDEALARALRELVTAPAGQVEAMGVAGRRYAVERLSADSYARDLETILAGVTHAGNG